MSVFSSIEKPTLLLNEAAARKNIARMAQKARTNGVRFRPHFKTHQSAQVGEWFRAEGVSAITVSSVDMAEYFARHGWNDITIAFSANPRQAEALAKLARSIHLELLVENAASASRLAEAVRSDVDIWMKVDVGAHRTGLPFDDVDQAEALARAVQRTANFHLKGLLTHAGHTYAAPGPEEVCRVFHDSVEKIHRLRQALERRGLGSLQVTVGDTPGCSLCKEFGPVDEIRPGNFVYFDTTQAQIGSCQAEDIAVALACPVVAKHPERGEAVLYGGAIHLSKDRDRVGFGSVALPEGDGWGPPMEGAFISGLSQEHGIAHLRPEDLSRVQVGDLLCVLPAHSCLTVTCMRRCLTLSGQWIETMNA